MNKLTPTEIGKEWHNKRVKFAKLYQKEIRKYNPDIDYPSGIKAKRLNRIYNLYISYLNFPYLPVTNLPLNS